MKKLCNICPRKCNVDRHSKFGFCNAKKLEISKIMKHNWEEPIISGTMGSGTIFFTHCSLRCVYCQNYEISQKNLCNKEITPKELADIFQKLEQEHVHNINLVTPTHYTNEIIEALDIYRPNIPIVWNSSGYESVETIQKLKNYVDIYLVDFKYCDSEISKKYSLAPDYFQCTTKAILEMRNNQPNDIIENGIMKKGLIIRHLILPSCHKDSINILDWIYNNLGNDVYISLMGQYIPCFKASLFPEINRKLKPLEYKVVLNHLIKLGFENGFTQDLSSSSSQFIPDFLEE